MLLYVNLLISCLQYYLGRRKLSNKFNWLSRLQSTTFKARLISDKNREHESIGDIDGDNTNRLDKLRNAFAGHKFFKMNIVYNPSVYEHPHWHNAFKTFMSWKGEVGDVLLEHQRDYWWHGEFEMELFLYNNDDEFDLVLDDGFEEDIRMTYAIEKCAIALYTKDFVLIMTYKPINPLDLKFPIAAAAA